jgi:hypothetical protein
MHSFGAHGPSFVDQDSERIILADQRRSPILSIRRRDKKSVPQIAMEIAKRGSQKLTTRIGLVMENESLIICEHRGLVQILVYKLTNLDWLHHDGSHMSCLHDSNL